MTSGPNWQLTPRLLTERPFWGDRELRVPVHPAGPPARSPHPPATGPKQTDLWLRVGPEQVAHGAWKGKGGNIRACPTSRGACSRPTPVKGGAGRGGGTGSTRWDSEPAAGLPSGWHPGLPVASPPGPHPIHRSPTAGGTFNSATQIRSPPAESPHGSHCTRDGAKLLTQAGGLHRACPHPSLLSPLLLTPKPLASQLFLPRPRTPLCLSEYSSAWQVSPPPSVSTMASPRRPS